MKDINTTIKSLVHGAILNRLNNSKFLSKYEIVKKYPEFVIPRASFITLKQNGRLRGCIGSLVAHKELYDDLVINAQKAAFNDPRFSPLKLEELKHTSIEISILSDAVLVKYDSIENLKSKIQIGIDGVILKYNNLQATFLPQVWEDLKTFEEFFSSLAQKGGFDINSLNNGAIVYKYQVQKIR